ncbi:peptidyl-prolyl cis-trans isomerase [Nitzschia inconspicua]|uniref:peptidylprolyl isomerase n=1 Tax=Nitzschia inconspicua TaxID=303405 RepID=A0A9K3LUF9_9STRA|nr:peptidyl-prolyl cis-trans isomerase [Nitzschia inconspicua]
MTDKGEAAEGGATKAPTPNRCFFQISIGGEIQKEKIIMELDTRNCPKTSQSFLAMCTSAGRTAPKSPQPTYRGCEFHRVVPGFVVQGGDFERFDGTGGYSLLFGKHFADEYLQGKHDKAGLLSMANSGKNTNGSQFFITLQATPHLDGKHVMFGQVSRGMDVVHKMVDVERDARDRPITLQKITIVDCGVVKESNCEDRRDACRPKTAKKQKKHSRSSSKKRKRSHSDDETSGSSTDEDSSSDMSRERPRKKSHYQTRKNKRKRRSHSSDESNSSVCSKIHARDRKKKKDKKRRKTHKEKKRKRKRSSS